MAAANARREDAPLLQEESPGEIGMFERNCGDKNLPASVRVDFIKKVYGILFYMLAITFAIAWPFVANEKSVVDNFMATHSYIMPIVSCFFIIFYVMNMAVMVSMCFGPRVLIMYLSIFKTFPVNMVYLTMVSACFGFLVGFVCLQYTMQSVLLIFAVSAALIVALTIYAIKTEADFTGMGMYIFMGMLGLMFTGLIVALLPGMGQTMDRVIGGLGATLFAFVIVYDTQLIFGESKWSPHPRKIQFTLDMYAYGAYHLYLDFINFLLYMLRLFGDRR